VDRIIQKDHFYSTNLQGNSYCCT